MLWVCWKKGVAGEIDTNSKMGSVVAGTFKSCEAICNEPYRPACF